MKQKGNLLNFKLFILDREPTMLVQILISTLLMMWKKLLNMQEFSVSESYRSLIRQVTVCLGGRVSQGCLHLATQVDILITLKPYFDLFC